MNQISESDRCAGILVATSNRGKLRELRVLISQEIELYTLTDFSLQSPPETGRTFLENAILKADHASRAMCMSSLADDSGLEVDALGGRPGVTSARFAGLNASDDENNLKLVAEISTVPEPQRTANFVSAVAFRAPDGFILTAVGSLRGKIVLNPRGNNGFGYDAYFEIHDSTAGDFNGQTLAELSLEEKNTVSHRRRALELLVRNARAASTENSSARILHN